MIGKLSGRVESATNQHIIIDVNGVGYVVTVSGATLETVCKIGELVSLWIETQVREDAINLYGFATISERDAFRILITVQGVGAKSALSLLTILPPDRLARAIASADKAALAQAEGVGPKLALRIVTELKDKAPLIGAVGGSAPSQEKGSSVTTPSTVVMEDALSALIHLGYKRMDAYAALATSAARLGAEAKLDDLIRAGLSELSTQGSR